MVHTMRSGRHHPDGVLWIGAGHHEVVEERVPLVDIAPTILAHFGVEQPEPMQGRPLLLDQLGRHALAGAPSGGTHIP